MSKNNKKQPAASKVKPAETVYSASELASVARSRFDVLPEVVTTALKVAGKTEATFSQTQTLIKNFLKREVK